MAIMSKRIAFMVIMAIMCIFAAKALADDGDSLLGGGHCPEQFKLDELCCNPLGDLSALGRSGIASCCRENELFYDELTELCCQTPSVPTIPLGCTATIKLIEAYLKILPVGVIPPKLLLAFATTCGAIYTTDPDRCCDNNDFFHEKICCATDWVSSSADSYCTCCNSLPLEAVLGGEWTEDELIAQRAFCCEADCPTCANENPSLDCLSWKITNQCPTGVSCGPCDPIQDPFPISCCIEPESPNFNHFHCCNLENWEIPAVFPYLTCCTPNIFECGEPFLVETTSTTTSTTTPTTQSELALECCITALGVPEIWSNIGSFCCQALAENVRADGADNLPENLALILQKCLPPCEDVGTTAAP